MKRFSDSRLLYWFHDGWRKQAEVGGYLFDVEIIAAVLHTHKYDLSWVILTTIDLTIQIVKRPPSEIQDESIEARSYNSYIC